MVRFSYQEYGEVVVLGALLVCRKKCDAVGYIVDGAWAYNQNNQINNFIFELTLIIISDERCKHALRHCTTVLFVQQTSAVVVVQHSSIIVDYSSSINSMVVAVVAAVLPCLCSLLTVRGSDLHLDPTVS